MRRIASVWLPRWPILRFLTAQGSSRTIAPDQPFVLTLDAAGGPRIAAANPAAERNGLFIGQTLSDARAKAGGLLQARPLEADQDAEALRRLALWATRYTPAASAWSLENGGDGLFLDITGCAHLFGGEAALLADLTRRLKAFHLAARCAVADTAGAAWALSHHAACLPLCLPSGKEKEALSALPVKALRLSPDTHAALHRLGFKRIGMLIDAPRAPFAARFEKELLLRLDQALGLRPEALHYIAAPPTYHAQRQFLDPIFSQDIIILTVTKLVERLIPPLVRDGVGIRSLRLDLYRVDSEVQRLDIGLAAATRNPAHIARLAALKLDGLTHRLETGYGFDCVRLCVTSSEPFCAQQGDLASPHDKTAEAESHAGLIDTLRQRLGLENVRQLKPVESHIPERAEISVKVGDMKAVWPKPGDDRLRPPFLLPQAEIADVVALIPDGPPKRFRWRGKIHDVASAQGPERIAGEWWRSDRPELTRDYYCLENETGHRFWLYREGLYGRETDAPRWFVHGFFA